ncbi:MAG: hypothetical protein QOK15_2616 [Nocardioidaceae bacterium]|nr:hypothetical protein [Nocardioidaceae bacterium]
MTGPLPVSPVPEEARPYQGQPAGVVSRLAAGTLDVLLLLLLLGLGYAGLNAVLFLARPRAFALLTAPQPVLLAVTGLTAITYLAGTWWLAGRTYGCDVMGLRLVDRHGRRPRLGLAVARATLYVVFPAGLLLCALTRSRRSLQDLLVGTSVIYHWLPTSEPDDAAVPAGASGTSR